MNTLALMRGAAAAQIDGLFERYHPAMYKAMWVDGRNLDDIEEVARGVFGAPTMSVEEMMFFGNDRLPFVEKALKGELG